MVAARAWRATVALALVLAGCAEPEDIPGEEALTEHVKANRYGGSPDHWIQALNDAGEWESTGLIFGYAGGNGDYEECLKAIGGMKRSNPGRKYRCVPAN